MHRALTSGRLAALFTLWLAGGAVAATFTTVQAGDWDAPTTWGGAVPTATDNAQIQHAVQIWSTSPITNVLVLDGGSLALAGSGSDLQYSGDITTVGTGTLNLAGDPAATLTVTGSGARNLPAVTTFARVVINPGCNATHTGNMTVTGLDIYGSFVNPGGLVTQTGSDQVITRDNGSASFGGTVSNFVVDTLAQFTLAQPLTVTGSWGDLSTGGFDANGQPVTISGGGTVNYTGTSVFGNLIIDGATFAVQTNSSLGYTGSVTAANGGLIDFENNLPSTLAPTGGGVCALPDAAMIVNGVVGSIAGGTSTQITGGGNYTLRGSLSYDNDVTLSTGTLTVVGPSSLVGAGRLTVANLTVSSGAVDVSHVGFTATGTINVAGGSLTGDGTMGALTIASGATVTLVDDLAIGGDLTNAGTFTATGNRVTFGGSPSLLTGNTTLDALTVTNQLTLAPSTTLTLVGSAVATGTLDATATGAGLAFSGATVHVLPDTVRATSLTVPAGQEVDLRATGTISGGVTVNGTLDASSTALTVGGALSVAGTGSFLGRGTFGSVALASGAGATQTGDWSVAGNFADQGAIFAHNDHTLTFTGTSTVTGATALGSLTVATGGQVTAASPLTVSGAVDVVGSLNTTGGGLRFVGTGDQAFTSTNALTLASLLVGPNARVIQAPASAAITVSGSFDCQGRISRTLPVSGPGLLDFGLAQARVTVATLGTLSSLQCVLVGGDHPNRAVHINGGRYWQFNETGTGYTVAIDLPQASATPDAVQICRYSGTGLQWTSYNTTAANGRAVATGITGFSEWAISDGGEVTDPTRTVTTVPAATFAASPTAVTVRTYQSDGTLRTTGGDTLAGSVTGANTATLSVVDNADGTYTLSYTPTELGDDSIGVTLGGNAVPGSPFTTTVGLGTPSAATSTATVPAGVAGAATTIVVTLRDGAGHSLTAGGATVAVGVTGANTATATVTDNNDGTYTAVYTPTASGDDAVAISVGGTALAGSPFTSAVVAGAAVATTSTASATPTTLPADGESAAVVTVVVRDANSNPVAGANGDQVTITPSTTTGVTVGAVSTAGANGACTANVTSSAAVAVTLTVKVNGTALAQTITLTYRPATVFTLAAGTHFIGLPQTPDNATPTGVLGSGDWRLAYFDRISHANQELDRTLATAPAAYNFQPGRGLWLKLSTPLTLRTMGELVSSDRFTLPLGQGWNAVANPYNVDVPWRLEDMVAKQNNATVASMDQSAAWQVVYPYAWTYDSANNRYQLVMHTFGESTTIPRGAGMWLFSERDNAGLELRKPATARAQRTAPSQPTARNWLINLTATAANGDLSGAAVGVAANFGRTVTIMAPPAVSGEGAVSLAVVSGEKRAAGEVRPGDGSPQSWDLAVTSRAAQPVTLSWGGLLRELPRGVVVELTDLQSGRVTLLNTRGGYTFSPERAGEERRLRLTARLGHIERADITALSASPTRGRAVGLSMTLSAPAEVTLLVKGLGGRLVRTLSYGQQSSGSLALSWDGADQNGRALPAGAYLLEATAVAGNGAVSRAQRTVTLP